MTSLNELLKPNSNEEAEEFAVENLLLSIQIALQKAMTSKGYSQKMLADALSVSEARVSQMLSSGGSNLTLRSVGKIAHALDQVFELVTKEEAEVLHTKPSLAQDVQVKSLMKAPRRKAWSDTTANENRFPFEKAA
ncbi:helix-turn-helix domain-containing protein [Ruegeria sp. ANG10]|uniref:helix-turn-helix domain-containing protein n=1 Tax=Ruegeria sp. ANG10 TaxID=3042467 RepID=UPI003451E874